METSTINFLFLLCLFASAFALPLDPEPDSFDNCTEANQFNCANGNCIPLNLRCNNEDDCGDGTDENLCDIDLIPCEDPNEFRCMNTLCISNSSICDGKDDCGDSSDEQNCSHKVSEPVVCQKGEWQCSDKSACIPVEKVCNGKTDCADQSDEIASCNTKIECDGFICKNGNCIPSEWVCDGQNDCSDKSDEFNCPHNVMADDATTTESNETKVDEKEVKKQEPVSKLLKTICPNIADLELQQAEELHALKMQIEEENLKAALLKVKVAELQTEIEETRLDTAKLDVGDSK